MQRPALLRSGLVRVLFVFVFYECLETETKDNRNRKERKKQQQQKRWNFLKKSLFSPRRAAPEMPKKGRVFR